jgi:MtN3 and saliva related transmembrane protein
VPLIHIDLVGYSAAACTTLAFVPQVLKIHRERSTDDISAGMYVIYIAGVGLWLAYGVLVSSWPIILANSATMCLAILVLWMKWRLTYRGGFAAAPEDSREREPDRAAAARER